MLLPQIPAMSSLSALFSVLREHPYVSAILDINGCISFLELVRLIKPDLELHLRPGDIGPMERLTLAAHGFLVDCLGLKSEDMKLIWYTLRDVAWDKSHLAMRKETLLGGVIFRNSWTMDTTRESVCILLFGTLKFRISPSLI